jgi:hypothetical protein
MCYQFSSFYNFDAAKSPMKALTIIDYTYRYHVRQLRLLKAKICVVCSCYHHFFPLHLF